MIKATAAVTVFETFGEQDGPQDAKTEADGEKFRMSERQRVRGTAVDSWFCEARGNLVSNTVMPPFIPHNLENPFRVFRVFRGSFYKFRYRKKECSMQNCIEHSFFTLTAAAASPPAHSVVIHRPWRTNTFVS